VPCGTFILMIVDISQLQLSTLREDKRLPSLPIALLECIEFFGQTDPVIVRPLSQGKYEILRHAETWLAVQRLGRFNIEILVRNNLSNAEAAELVNLPRALDPISEAELFQERVGFHRRRGDITKLAQQFKVSRSHVAHGLRLLELPESIQASVRAGVLCRGHAKALLTLVCDSDRQQFASRIVAGKWSVGKTEREVRTFVGAKGARDGAQTKSPETIRLERQLSEKIGSGVTIDEIGGTLTINYQRNLDVLDGIINRIAGGELVCSFIA